MRHEGQRHHQRRSPARIARFSSSSSCLLVRVTVLKIPSCAAARGVFRRVPEAQRVEQQAFVLRARRAAALTVRPDRSVPWPAGANRCERNQVLVPRVELGQDAHRGARPPRLRGCGQVNTRSMKFSRRSGSCSRPSSSTGRRGALHELPREEPGPWPAMPPPSVSPSRAPCRCWATWPEMNRAGSPSPARPHGGPQAGAGP